MTRQLQHKTKCPECSHEFDTTTPFSQWMRNLPAPLDSANVSSQNLDYIWHWYGPNWFILIEEKRNGGATSFAQRDTHGIVDQMLKAASGCTVVTAKNEKKPAYYRGYYVVSFEKTTPDDSAWVKINDKQYDDPAATIKRLLTDGTLEPLKLVEKPVSDIPDDAVFVLWLNQFTFPRLAKLMRFIADRMDELYQKAEKAS